MSSLMKVEAKKPTEPEGPQKAPTVDNFQKTVDEVTRFILAKCPRDREVSEDKVKEMVMSQHSWRPEVEFLKHCTLRVALRKEYLEYTGPTLGGDHWHSYKVTVEPSTKYSGHMQLPDRLQLAKNHIKLLEFAIQLEKKFAKRVIQRMTSTDATRLRDAKITKLVKPYVSTLGSIRESLYLGGVKLAELGMEDGQPVDLHVNGKFVSITVDKKKPLTLKITRIQGYRFGQ